jgi:hypothetical protein
MKCSETEIRLMAMRHISKVANLLGPDATVQDFLPQLEERTYLRSLWSRARGLFRGGIRCV